MSNLPAYNTLELLKTKRFRPLFIVQFLGALNDNFFKQAMVILITYKLAAETKMDVASLVAIAGATLILPFILFSSIAGNIADKYDKAAIVRRLKFLEIIIMLLAGVSLYLQRIELLYVVLFLLGTQSAFFGPLKYAIIPFHLEDNELVAGNALIEAATFIAILLGSIIGGLLVQTTYGYSLTTVGMLAAATIGWLSARQIPDAPAQRPDLKLRWNIAAESFYMVKQAFTNHTVMHATLGLSWFWGVAAIVFSLLPVLASETVRADETVATFFLATFSVAIALGSLLVNKLAKGRLIIRYSLIGLLGVSASLLLLAMILPTLEVVTINTSKPISPEQLIGLGAFLALAKNWLLLIALFLMGLCVGPYITPLYALIQHSADNKIKGVTIASSNITNSIFIVLSAFVLIYLRDYLQLSLSFVCIVVALINLLALYHVYRAMKLHQQEDHHVKA